jgi:hypothetical protein
MNSFDFIELQDWVEISGSPKARAALMTLWDAEDVMLSPDSENQMPSRGW